MASTSEKPKKGILKNSSSTEYRKKEIEWDEMNIMATYHPAGKDYGHMKVDEPPTPYNRAAVSDGDDDLTRERRGSITSVPGLDPTELLQRLAPGGTNVDRKYYQDDDEENEEDYENMTEEEKAKRRAFLMKRKMHYNEFLAVQLGKKLLAEEDDDDEGDDVDEKNKTKASNQGSPILSNTHKEKASSSSATTKPSKGKQPVVKKPNK